MKPIELSVLAGQGDVIFIMSLCERRLAPRRSQLRGHSVQMPGPPGWQLSVLCCFVGVCFGD